MPFDDLERKKIKNALIAFLEKHRPPVHIRSQLDIGYRITGRNIEIFELRPQLDNSAVAIEVPVAKATFVKRKNIWKLYWMRGTGKWCLYVPEAEFKTIEKLLNVVGKDKDDCFFG
jgi:hypothetical protein